jgi:putative selenate reductase YgfK subunit
MKKQNGNGKIGAVLVVGGGIGGVQASLDLAESGYYVYLVEKSPSIGGVMAQLDKTFPTNDCSMCILSPKLVEVASHQNVSLHTYTEIENISGEAGNFTVKLRKKATFVDWEKCTGCGVCSEWCPVVMKSEFNTGLGPRRAIYTPFPQAVPKKCVIDKREERLCHAACRDACPLHMNVPGYVKLIAEGQHEEAYKLIRATNPLPGICGRICYAPCQEACNRGQVDEPVAIRELKRFATDCSDLDKLEVPTVESSGKSVAIIGAGPAGLVAAHDLAIRGHRAVIFEALPKPGGMLQVGIPEYRLPKEVVRKEIEYIAKLGVEMKTGVEVGKDITLGELRDEFSAIFIGVGAHQGMELKSPGEELPGVLQGVDFLRNVNLGKKARVGRKVAVIGGGNTALDCARTAKRLGAEEVTILYRRTRAEMPASAEEIDAAEAESIKLEFLVAPSRFVGNKRLSKVELIKMKLGAPDASGRPRPMPIEGSEFQLPVNTIIAALGQVAKLDFVKELGVSVSKRGTIEVNPDTGATNIEGVFAGGDVVTGPAYVVDAMAAGRRAASSIDAFLHGISLPVEERVEPQKLTEEEVQRLKNRFGEHAQHQITEIPLEQREGFEEVSVGYAAQEACEEAGRCLAGNVTGCIGCLECVDRCEAKAIDHSMQDTFEEVKVGAVVFAGG